MSHMAERLTVTAQEAATIIGVSESMVYKLAKTGALPTLRAGRRVLVRRADLFAWLQSPQ